MATKDWKTEYEKLKGVNTQLERELQYYKHLQELEYNKANQVKDTFKQLLIDVLGK